MSAPGAALAEAFIWPTNHPLEDAMTAVAKASASQKPRRPRVRKCPQCGSTETTEIMYGYPSNMDAALKAAREGLISLGGCVIEEDSPRWRCRECGHGWGRLPR